uniref:Uncharacterized protein n=1 Tax=Glossina palpalis gambiensis TaxID=67801 RepID=A0A1B0C748_9MUSC
MIENYQEFSKKPRTIKLKAFPPKAVETWIDLFFRIFFIAISINNFLPTGFNKFLNSTSALYMYFNVISSSPYSSSTLYFNLNWRHSVVKLHQLRTGNCEPATAVETTIRKKLANICGGTVAHKQMWRSAILHRLCFYRMHSPLLAN